MQLPDSSILAVFLIAVLTGDLIAGEKPKKETTQAAGSRIWPPGFAYEAKVVDTKAMAEKSTPFPKEGEDGYVPVSHRERGQLVRVRRKPSLKAPVFAEFAGGAVVEVFGKPVQKDGIVWVEAAFLGVRGWVPQNRLSRAISGHDHEHLPWDIHFISPSGQVVVEYVNRAVGSVYVIKDGITKSPYGLPLKPDDPFMVSDILLFAKDENCLALTHGGVSWGTEVLVFGRNGNGVFVTLNTNLQERCWALARQEGLIPEGATPAHLYMQLEEALESGFVVRFAGNYSFKDQTNFGPMRLVWNQKGDDLTLKK